MARGRKKKEVTRILGTPGRKENIDLGNPPRRDDTMENESMEQWPPLPMKEGTTNPITATQRDTSGGSESQAGEQQGSGIQAHRELQPEIAEPRGKNG
ncbi:hypothetical protein R3W88_022394 [Solanum pinnatisectum]|uniref:Uncharacterized protein n=1 Tax=Solanum pinnatisectum TaxID=50273 RepID=A0AAV9LUJ2_9SOLN|nr:hypothetical protein R3W88_022394 [Solanum pinnatisectum]